ncbi:response regulator transcription factor [Kitasatospora sp. NPDC059673]|uniref:response regulator transcription factor n=1 Tax=Kitasatospora sp. NPDC059673 TaxID=3346901 RepID=UPI0036A61A72
MADAPQTREAASNSPPPGRPTFFPREAETLQLLAEGLSSRQISKRPSISEATAKTHPVHIQDKLGVNSRTSAIAAGSPSGPIRAVERRVRTWSPVDDPLTETW